MTINKSPVDIPPDFLHIKSRPERTALSLILVWLSGSENLEEWSFRLKLKNKGTSMCVKEICFKVNRYDVLVEGFIVTQAEEGDIDVLVSNDIKIYVIKRKV